MQIVLELRVGDDLTGSLALVCEDAAFQRAVGLRGACYGGGLGGELGGQGDGVVFEVAGVIGGASFWDLGGDEGGCCQGGESGCVLHGG